VARIGDGGDLLKCSFCGKSQKQVKKLNCRPGRVHMRRLHRPSVNEIIEEELAEPARVSSGTACPKAAREIYEFLDAVT